MVGSRRTVSYLPATGTVSMALSDIARSDPGTYILVLHLGSPRCLTVGALGSFELAAGYYLYVGSALNGLAGRLRRHCRTDSKRLHWHIDYLRGQTALVEVWGTVSAERLECEWAAALRRLPGVSEPVAGFGASDCRCFSHLFYLTDKPSGDELSSTVTQGPAASVEMISCR